MARLTRKNIKVFAGSATNNGVFGSLQANNPVQTNDVEQIQGLSAWSEGWNEAAMTGESLPPLEEFQAVQYVVTYEQAYLMQEGIPEWASTVTYFKGSLTKQVTTNGFRIYCSLADNNIGNVLSDTSKWKVVMDSENLYAMQSDVTQLQTDMALISYVGDIKTSVRTANHGNWFLCNGQAISRTTYSTLFSLIGTTYGEGDGSTTFNIPDFTNVALPTSSEVNVMGNGYGLGLTSSSDVETAGYWVSKDAVEKYHCDTIDINQSPILGTKGGGKLAYGVTGVTTNPIQSGLTGSLKNSMSMNFFIRVK